MQLKDKLLTMSEEEQLQLLATNGMLVKRPLVVEEDLVLVGFKETEWTEKLKSLCCIDYKCSFSSILNVCICGNWNTNSKGSVNNT